MKLGDNLNINFFATVT